MKTKLIILAICACANCFAQVLKGFELNEETYQGIDYIRGYLIGESDRASFVYDRKDSKYRDQDAGYNPAYYNFYLPNYKFEGKNELVDFLADLLGESIPDYVKENYYNDGLIFKTYFNIRGEIQEVNLLTSYPKKEVFPLGEYISLENYYKIEQFILKNCKWDFVPNLSIDGAKFLSCHFQIYLNMIHNRWLEKNKKETE